MAYLAEDTPKLGFGLMRLPKNEDGTTNIEELKTMVDAFMTAGGTYFDTARIYGTSEADIKKALVDRYPRESYTLASKITPWAGCTTAEEARAQFDTSLAETGAGYFDYYLVHNVGDKRTLVHDKFGTWEFVQELKAAGKVKHIGFSLHDSAAVLEQTILAHRELEFVQLQVNYADWEVGNTQSRKCMEVAAKYGLPVVIMEPVRGGVLANPPQAVANILAQANPESTPVEWALRFCMSLPNLITVLSGMSTQEQMEQNLQTWKNFQPLSNEEHEVLKNAQAKLAEIMDNPCTNCHYCMKNCPMDINISAMMKVLNIRNLYGQKKAGGEYRFGTNGFAKPADCISCGQCEDACPQHIAIREKLEEVAQQFG